MIPPSPHIPFCVVKNATEGGSILIGIHVVVLSYEIIKEFPLSHPGMHKMKLSRSHVWWTKMDQDIQEVVKSCCACQEVKQAPTVAPLQSWVCL